MHGILIALKFVLGFSCLQDQSFKDLFSNTLAGRKLQGEQKEEGKDQFLSLYHITLLTASSYEVHH